MRKWSHKNWVSVIKNISYEEDYRRTDVIKNLNSSVRFLTAKKMFYYIWSMFLKRSYRKVRTFLSCMQGLIEINWSSVSTEQYTSVKHSNQPPEGNTLHSIQCVCVCVCPLNTITSHSVSLSVCVREKHFNVLRAVLYHNHTQSEHYIYLYTDNSFSFKSDKLKISTKHIFLHNLTA